MSGPAAIIGAMFDACWWSLPLPARYASIAAKNSGIAVSVELWKTSGYWEALPCIVWRGKAEQFMATQYFADGITAKRSSGKWAAVEQLRGTVYPDGAGHYIFVIEGCNHHGKATLKRSAKAALDDENYLDFRNAVMTGYPLPNLDA